MPITGSARTGLLSVIDAEASQAMPGNFLLRQAPATLLRRLRPHLKKVVFAGGEYVNRPDEKIDSIYFPETMAFSELHILEDGRTIEVSLTGRESAVGVIALYWPASASNWVQASVPGTALKVNRDILAREVRLTEKGGGVFHRAIQAYVAQLAQKVACNAHHSVEQRFASWLLMLRDRCPAHRLKLTQEHIARVLGVYRPSVTCIAQSMRDQGLIDYVRSNIVILDPDGLTKIGCNCCSELPTAGLAVPDHSLKKVRLM